MEDAGETGRPGDPDRGAQGEARADQDKQRVLRRVTLEMREGS